MRNDAATVGCAVLIVAVANIGFWLLMVGLAAEVVKHVFFS